MKTFFIKIWNYIKQFWAKTKNVNIINNSVKVSSNNSNININNPVTIIEGKESVDAFSNQIIQLFKDYCIVDVDNFKFKYYLNQSMMILKLNDTPLKREALKKLLYMKFDGEWMADDSDAPTTISLEAMKYLTDITIKRLCSFRLLTNVLPSLLDDSNYEKFPLLIKFLNNVGMLSESEIMNLRRLGILYDMSDSIYTIEPLTSNNYIQNALKDLRNIEESSLLSYYLSPAGMLLTDISLEFFLEIKDTFDIWLPVCNKSLHLKELIVDEDVMVKKNIVANGDVSA